MTNKRCPKDSAKSRFTLCWAVFA